MIAIIGDIREALIAGTNADNTIVTIASTIDKSTPNKEGAYTIKFEGETTDNVISGKFSGTLLSHSYTGTWSANGESNAFSASVKGSENDPLGFSNKFVEGLNRATSYKGNYDNLFIYYKDEGGRELCLVFHVDKDNNK